jgi:hypothetical protein
MQVISVGDRYRSLHGGYHFSDRAAEYLFGQSMPPVQILCWRGGAQLRAASDTGHRLAADGSGWLE